MRKMGNTQTPTSTFSLEGDEYTMKTASTLKTSEVKFKLGQEFKETTMDGREAMTTFTLSGDVLTQVRQRGVYPHLQEELSAPHTYAPHTYAPHTYAPHTYAPRTYAPHTYAPLALTA